MKILLVDDSAPVRRTLRDLIEISGEHSVVAEAANGQEAVQMADELKPDLVLMDVNMPVMTGVDATRAIREKDPHVKILALTALGDMAHVSSMVKAGASGYLLKGGRSDELLESIRAVARGEGALDKEVGLDVIKGMADLEAQLRQAQKMESVGQLVGGIAHDFNNVISVIINYANFIRADLSDDDSKQEDLAEITKAAERAAGLVAQLMTFSRKEEAAPELVNVNDAVAAAAKLWSRALGEDIALQTDLADDLPLIRIDPTHLDQILMNLVVNARDSMPTGGHLTISTAAAADAPEGHDGVIGHITIAVMDTGSGMEPEIAERVFDPFFTTKPRDYGTGLGLATVHGIVKQALGWIELDTAPGRGSTFRIYLPVAEESQAQVIAVEDPDGNELVNAGRRVLVIEDDEAVCRMVERILLSGGYQIRCAYSAADAERLAATESFDVILSDVILPGKPGPELVRTLRERGSTASIVLMSGYPDQVLSKHDLPEGAPLIQKPFSAAGLLGVIASTFRGEPQRSVTG